MQIEVDKVKISYILTTELCEFEKRCAVFMKNNKD